MLLTNPGRWRQHVALDLGTATTRIAAGDSPAIELPSQIGTKRALHGGVVVDGELVLHILKPLLAMTRKLGVFKPCVLTCAPSDVRQEERQLLVDSIMKAGAASISVIPEPLAAAVGAGIDISSPYARMVVDIGEGVTDCAIIRLGKIIATHAIRVGCDRMRRSIVKTAEGYGVAHVDDSHADMLMRSCGLNRSADNSGSILTAAALQPVVEELAAVVDFFLREMPQDIGCEVIDSGICLTGGGALIPGVADYFAQRTGIGVTIANNPLGSVVEGARAILPVVQTLNQWR